MTRRNAGSVLGDASGSVADLGILVPIVAALVLRNGLDPATALVGVGALYLAAGLYFRVPVPVQPIKAAAAIAIARGLAPATLSAAGIVLGATLLVLALTGGATWLTRLFAQPIVRGIQLGVGLILVRAAFHLQEGPMVASTLVVALVVAAALLVGMREQRRFPLALTIVAGGILASVFFGPGWTPVRPSLWHPAISREVFRASTLWPAFVVLVIPQIPLTFGNAIVALTDLEHKYFGGRGKRVTPVSTSVSCGLANVVVGALGGMPMCHGSGGLTAHYRAGARTNRMNVIIGGALLVLGLAFGPAALRLLALIPLAVLMGFLIFTGVMHAALVADMRSYDLLVATSMGLAGAVTSNLALALAIGLVVYWPVRFARRALEPA